MRPMVTCLKYPTLPTELPSPCRLPPTIPLPPPKLPLILEAPSRPLSPEMKRQRSPEPRSRRCSGRILHAECTPLSGVAPVPGMNSKHPLDLDRLRCLSRMTPVCQRAVGVLVEDSQPWCPNDHRWTATKVRFGRNVLSDRGSREVRTIS